MASIGRGKALKEAIARRNQTFQSDNASEAQMVSISEKVKKEGTAGLPALENLELFDLYGTEGKPVDLLANYVRLEKNTDNQAYGIHEYVVEFSPQIDSRQEKFKLLAQNDRIIGRFRVFDGSRLFVPFQAQETCLTSLNESSGTRVEIKLKYQGIKPYHHPICSNILNNLFHKIMYVLNFVKIGKNGLFNPEEKYFIPLYKLELWPGFVTSVEDLKGGLLLACEVNHKILRTETIYNYVKHHPNKNEAVKSLINMVVITRYNHKTYRIDDVAMNMSPLDEFSLASGEKMTYVKYYQTKYNLNIEDLNQPLLISRKKVKSNHEKNVERTFCLIPELCYLTGLSEEMRNNFRIMKEVSSFTRLTPRQRQDALENFVRSVKNNAEATEILRGWGLAMGGLVQLKGRVLNNETLYFGKGTSFKVDQRADWTHMASRQLLTPVNVLKWLLVYPEKCRRNAQEFEKFYLLYGKKMGIIIGNAKHVFLNNDRIDFMLEQIRSRLDPSINLVVTIFPQQRSDRYAAFKKLCCLEFPIPSQVILNKTLDSQKRLSGVVQKVALQINCKLGGELWGCSQSVSGLMVVGVDVFHDPTCLGSSYAAMVSSTNNAFSLWYSNSIGRLDPKKELIDRLQVAFIDCLRAYRSRNNAWPSSVLFFRDGISDSQIEYSSAIEVNSLKEALGSVVEYEEPPKFGYVIVQKRINTRLWSIARNVDNPPPGTVVDKTITRKNYFDFYLVSQSTRQGTVSPTHYVVTEATLSPDVIQKVSYQLTHMYFNWCGTIRVPAPCLYSHKLAAFIGEHMHQSPRDEILFDKLYYL